MLDSTALRKKRRFNSVLVCWMFTETVKTPEGENMEHSEGSIKVFFRNQIEVKAGRGRFLGWPITLAWSWWNYHVFFFKLTPIISDPEYLLDQHILISVKSTDSYESYGNRQRQLQPVVLCEKPLTAVLCFSTCAKIPVPIKLLLPKLISSSS